jgi:hypothetical protein
MPNPASALGEAIGKSVEAEIQIAHNLPNDQKKFGRPAG